MVGKAIKNRANFAPTNKNAKSEAVKKISSIARQHRLSYEEFVSVCQQVRNKLRLTKTKKERQLPEILSMTELKQFFKAVQSCEDLQHELMLKLLLYTAIRVSELVNIRVSDVDLDACKIFINQGKGSKDRYILFPSGFRLALKSHLKANNQNKYLFESRLNQPYTTRRIQQIVKEYCERSGLRRAVHPHLLRHQMLTYLTSRGISDAKIQLISGHESRKSLEVYQHLSLESVEKEYQQALRVFEV
ncbi:MAG: integrase/recombinase XerD [Cyanobacteriota bacterium erpe_2018_sw_21hr_WHONDRS-SW48-000092_B_bin.40]|nr:integrase/recombinase XerD [Cyanobacteriota bacterium erpe_2018_sw_21hr_WHONDRS-SW48-000092_B_bin.40]